MDKQNFRVGFYNVGLNGRVLETCWGLSRGSGNILYWVCRGILFPQHCLLSASTRSAFSALQSLKGPTCTQHEFKESGGLRLNAHTLNPKPLNPKPCGALL